MVPRPAPPLELCGDHTGVWGEQEDDTGLALAAKQTFDAEVDARVRALAAQPVVCTITREWTQCGQRAECGERGAAEAPALEGEGAHEPGEGDALPTEDDAFVRSGGGGGDLAAGGWAGVAE